MSQALQTVFLAAASPSELFEKICQTCEKPHVGPPLDEKPKIGKYVLIFGPSGEEGAAGVQMFKELPDDIEAVGSSITLAFTKEGKLNSKWGALVVQSLYIEPTATFAEFSRKKNETQLEEFIKPLPTEYFTPGQVHYRIKGAHGVEYRRPAYMLLMLPGTGFYGDGRWPEGNVDYQIVSALSERASEDLTIFGYSATGNAAKNKQSAARPWLFAKSKQRFWAGSTGVAAILVQSDLTFGCASANGFVAETKDHCSVSDDCEKDADILFGEQSNRRQRFHKANLRDEFGLLKKIKTLARHTAEMPQRGPLIDPKAEWLTLGFFEGNEFIPNPAYQSPNGKPSFLLPLARGTPLFMARVSRKSLVQSVPKAIGEAKKRGKVSNPSVTLIANCRGRHWCLDAGDHASVKEEARAAGKELDASELCLGLYADGETCPIQRNVAFHRNWSVSSLVLGSDFNVGFLNAARNCLLTAIDQARYDFGTEEAVLGQILHSAIALTQADGGHVRMLRTADLGSLKKVVEYGAFSALMPDALNLEDQSSDISVRAYQTRKPTSGRSFNLGAIRPAATEAEKEICENVKWRIGQPIIAGTGEVLGVLSINSSSPKFFSQERSHMVADILDELSRKASSVLKAQMNNNHLQEALKAFAKQFDLDQLIQHGAKLLSPHATLMLMLPKSKTLECEAFWPIPKGKSPADIYVSIDKDSPVSEQGISGHAFLNPGNDPDMYLIDDVSEANGEGGRPKFKSCLGDSYVRTLGSKHGELKQNYAVLVRHAASEFPLGVLIAEAPANVLNKQAHSPLLQTIADACASVLTKKQHNSQFRKCLATLLPPHIVTDLFDLQEGKAKDPIPTPSPRRTVILNADIRGYTRMSEIVGEANIIEFQYDYFRMVAEAIQKKEGILDKFMGDGVMALFDAKTREWLKGQKGEGPPPEVPDDITRADIESAVEAGFQIAENFALLAAQWLPKWRKRHPAILRDHRFDIAVAIHCGNPICGLFTTAPSSNGRLANIPAMPEEGHTTYTVIGRDANLAARVCSAVDQNTVWITAPCWELLKESHGYDQNWIHKTLEPDTSMPPVESSPLASGQPVKLKGIPHPIDIFQVKRQPTASKSQSGK